MHTFRGFLAVAIIATSILMHAADYKAVSSRPQTPDQPITGKAYATYKKRLMPTPEELKKVVVVRSFEMEQLAKQLRNLQGK